MNFKTPLAGMILGVAMAAAACGQAQSVPTQYPTISPTQKTAPYHAPTPYPPLTMIIEDIDCRLIYNRSRDEYFDNLTTGIRTIQMGGVAGYASQSGSMVIFRAKDSGIFDLEFTLAGPVLEEDADRIHAEATNLVCPLGPGTYR